MSPHDSNVRGVEPENGSFASNIRKVGLLREAVRLCLASNRRLTLGFLAVHLVSGIALGAQLLVARWALDHILEVRGAGGSIGSISGEIAALTVITVVVGLSASFQSSFLRLLPEETGRHVSRQILAVASRVDVEQFERPEFHDRLDRALRQGIPAPLKITTALSGVVAGGVGTIAILVALLFIQPLIVPVLLVGTVPLWMAGSRASKEYFEFSFANTQPERRRFYFLKLLVSPDAAKEVRSLSLVPWLRRRWEGLYEERIDEVRDLMRRDLRRSLIAGMASSVLVAGLLVGVGYLLVTQRLSLSAAAVAGLAIYQLNTRLRSLAQSASVLYESALFVDDYRSFLELGPPGEETPAALDADEPDEFQSVRAEDVTYAYPGSAKPVLHDVSLEVGAGEIVALVGPNGSGKTTLAKILAGLYAPAEGRIRWNGDDMSDADLDAYRRRVAVTFQDFHRFQLSAAENITVGRFEQAGDRDRMVEAAETAGASPVIDGLPDGYDTMLSREFGSGVDLSLGQWQRLALARTVFRQAPFVVLDEPSAALDARAELDLFESVRRVLAGKGVLLISHRFSSVRNADRIYVLRNGRVVEVGDHRSLMDHDGFYAEMFSIQAAAYQDPPLQPVGSAG